MASLALVNLQHVKRRIAARVGSFYGETIFVTINNECSFAILEPVDLRRHIGLAASQQHKGQDKA